MIRYRPTVLALALLCTPGVLDAQDGARSEAHRHLEEIMGFYLEGGGRWTAENPSFTSGGTAPRQIGYHFRWDWSESVVRNTIFGVFEDGGRRTFAEVVFAWDPHLGRVEQFLFGSSGGIGRGFEAHLDDGIIVAELSWVNAAGSRSELKDWVQITGGDTFDNATYEKDAAGDWQLQPNSELKYRRIRD